MAEDGQSRSVGLLVEYAANAGSSRVVGLLVEYRQEAQRGANRASGLLVEYGAEERGSNRVMGLLLEYTDTVVVPLVPVPALGHWNDTWIQLWETIVLNSGGTLAARENAHFEDWTRTLIDQAITLAGGTPIGFMAYNDFVRKALAELVTAAGGTAPNMYAGRWEDVVRAALVELVDAVGGVQPSYHAWNGHVLRLLQAIAAIGV